MYWLTKIAKHRFLAGLVAMVAFSLVFAPALLAVEGSDTDTDTFGLTPVEDNIKLGKRDLRETIAQIINVALSLLGVVAVVIILIGGFKWMTAGGNEEKVGEARKLIFAGIIGLAIILAAWAIARFVIERLSEATGSGVVPPST